MHHHLSPDVYKELAKLIKKECTQNLYGEASSLFDLEKAAKLIEKFTAQGEPTEDFCECGRCSLLVRHAADCALHNEPMLPIRPCDCDALQ